MQPAQARVTRRTRTRGADAGESWAWLFLRAVALGPVGTNMRQQALKCSPTRVLPCIARAVTNAPATIDLNALLGSPAVAAGTSAMVAPLRRALQAAYESSPDVVARDSSPVIEATLDSLVLL